MPKALEEKLKKRYGKDSKIPYKIMNKMGFMHGSKETAKGRKAEKKHEAKVHSRSRIRGLGGEVKRPATRSSQQGKSFAENLTGKRYR
jgi:hypothetical protein